MLAQETLKKPLGPCIPNGNPSGWSGEPLGSAGETGHGAIGLCLFAGCLWQHITKKTWQKNQHNAKLAYVIVIMSFVDLHLCLSLQISVNLSEAFIDCRNRPRNLA